jgi:hypothetical protein
MFERSGDTRTFPNATYMVACAWSVASLLCAVGFGGAREHQERVRARNAVEAPCPPGSECINFVGWDPRSLFETGLDEGYLLGTPVTTLIAIVSARRWRRKGTTFRRLLMPWGLLATLGATTWGILILLTFWFISTARA